MSIGAICNREVVIASKNETILEAADLMRKFHVGTLVVAKESEAGRIPIGILTDRDIVVEVIAKGMDVGELFVKEVMSSNPVTVRESDGISETLGLMVAKGIRRVPVVDDKGNLTGILSTDDVLDLLAEEFSDIAKLISHEQELEKETRV